MQIIRISISHCFSFPGPCNKDLFLPVEAKSEFQSVAIHTRVGRDVRSLNCVDTEEDDEQSGLFAPRVVSGKSELDTPSVDCLHWSIIAKTALSTKSPDCCAIQLFLIPQDWAAPSGEGGNDDDDDEYEELLEYCDDHFEDATSCSSGGGIPFYLTAELVLPPNQRVVDLSFYGDDGKSSLSSGIDCGTGRERRQALGLLVARKDPFGDEDIKLWLLKYDNVAFQLVMAKSESKQVFLDDANSIINPTSVHPLAEFQDENEEEDGICYAKSK